MTDLTSSLVLKAFLNGCSSEKRRALLQLLPQAEQEKILHLPDMDKRIAGGFSKSEQRLQTIHPTWLIPFLRKLSKSDLSLFISALSYSHVNEVRKLMLFSQPATPISSLAKAFMQERLYHWVKGGKTDLLPIECLPASPLNALLDLNSAELALLIKFLGLHDLALTVRQIIDTTTLKQINEALSEDEQLFIKKLTQRKETIAFPKIDLSKWKGDAEALHAQILKRGLNRLAKAFFGQNPSLVWYITRQLDTITAANFEKLCTPLEHLNAPRLLAEQVTSLLDMIQPSNRETL